MCRESSLFRQPVFAHLQRKRNWSGWEAGYAGLGAVQSLAGTGARAIDDGERITSCRAEGAAIGALVVIACLWALEADVRFSSHYTPLQLAGS